MRTMASILRPALCLSLLVAALTGCTPTHKPETAAAGNKPTTASAPLNVDASALDLYNAHRYAEARTKAEADILQSQGRDKEVAQLTAGLSAYALGQNALAEHHLDSLVGSSDKAIAGRAQAVLGQIAEKKGNHAYAADLFKRASTNLDGDDAAKAAVHAGTSLSEIGRPTPSAATLTSVAPAKPKPAASQSVVAGSHGPFTIQLGAFSTKKAADGRAREVAAMATKAGLGKPRVVPDTINGKPGYSVQVGSFAVKQAALNAKTRLGSGFVVAMN
jgi:septal ring-binding cell division protein DamX